MTAYRRKFLKCAILSNLFFFFISIFIHNNVVVLYATASLIPPEVTQKSALSTLLPSSPWWRMTPLVLTMVIFRVLISVGTTLTQILTLGVCPHVSTKAGVSWLSLVVTWFVTTMTTLYSDARQCKR